MTEPSTRWSGAPVSPAGSSRMRREGRGGRLSRRTRGAIAGTVVVVALAVTWLDPGQHGGSSSAEAVPPRPAAAATASGDRPQAAPTTAPADRSVGELPGLGADFTARVPADSRQVVLVSGQDRNSPESTLTLWSRRTDGRWQSVANWPTHNGFRGWTDHHDLNDLRSPIGVFTLSDAGGLRRDPGSRLPYHQDTRFVADGTGFEGEPLDDAFDYVIAIDYNRVPGSSPLDQRRPDGIGRGGGIWLHVDHGGPTHGCVSLSADHMVELLRLLDPAAHPVIVIGAAAALAA